MGTVTLPKLNQTGTNEWADVEDNDKALRDEINGNLDNTNLKSSAAIAHSKLANSTAGYILLANASGVITGTAVSGDATINSSGVVSLAVDSVGSSEIAAGAVTAAEIALGSVSTDTSSALTNITPSTWTNSGCAITAGSTGLYLVTCTGSVTNNAASVGAPAIGSKILNNGVAVEQLIYRVEIGASADLSWPFSHCVLASVTSGNAISHQVYSEATGSDVAASGFVMQMLRLST